MIYGFNARNLNLTTSRIETERCILLPFSLDGCVGVRELQQEFCLANKDLYVSPFLPSYEEELDFLIGVIERMQRGEIFENFILEKETNRLIGAIGLNTPEEYRMNIGLWIRESEHGKGYGTEVYTAMLDWARTHTTYQYLKHAVYSKNRASHSLALHFGGILQDERTDREHEIYHIPL